MKSFRLIIPLLLFLGYSLTLPAQESKTDTTQQDTVKTDEEKKKKSPYKDYSEVITEDAKSDEGLFTVHMVDDKLYYEIPFDMLNKEMLVVSRIVQLPTGLGGGYTNAGSKAREQVMRWQRKGKKVFLRIVSYTNIADEELPIAKSVKYNNLEPIVQAFDIKALNEDSTALVIEATDLFTKDVKAISGMPLILENQLQGEPFGCIPLYDRYGAFLSDQCRGNAYAYVQCFLSPFQSAGGVYHDTDEPVDDPASGRQDDASLPR
jgi:hypothetical protein